MTVVIFPAGVCVLVVLFIASALFPDQTKHVLKSAAVTAAFWVSIIGTAAFAWSALMQMSVPKRQPQSQPQRVEVHNDRIGDHTADDFHSVAESIGR